jgi:hypothetical protein
MPGNDRIEPRQEPDWTAMDFRRDRPGRHRLRDEDHRFAVAVTVFLAVAILYPWYSYWVHAYLLTREFHGAVEALQGELDRTGANMSAQAARSRASAEASRLRTATEQLAIRRGRVKVMGVSHGGPKPLVLVDLGTSNPLESDEVICREASVWLGRSLSGASIRIQQYRGKAPARDMGELSC